MDEPTLILTALAVGTSAGLQQTAGTAIKDAYTGFKTLLQRKFAGKPNAELTLTEYEHDPETWKAPFTKTIEQTHLDQDADIINAAKHLLALVHHQQAISDDTIIQNYGNVQGQVGKNTGAITMNFGEVSKPEE